MARSVLSKLFRRKRKRKQKVQKFDLLLSLGGFTISEQGLVAPPSEELLGPLFLVGGFLTYKYLREHPISIIPSGYSLPTVQPKKEPEETIDYALVAASEGGRAWLASPLQSYKRISSHFGAVESVRDHVHKGVDYAAPSGTPVYAISSGRVTVRYQKGGAGKYISIDHGNGLRSRYMHLSAYAEGLKTGDFVQTGQLIGYVGSTGHSTGAHLHFDVSYKGVFIDPEQFLQLLNSNGLTVSQQQSTSSHNYSCATSNYK